MTFLFLLFLQHEYLKHLKTSRSQFPALCSDLFGCFVHGRVATFKSSQSFHRFNVLTGYNLSGINKARMSGSVFVFVLAGTKTKLLEQKYSNPTTVICDIILKYWLQVLSGRVLGDCCVLLLLLINRLAPVTVVRCLKMNNNRVD